MATSEHEDNPKGEPQADVEPSAEKAGERIEAWYQLLDPHLGVHLTDPNVVLTLADARGQTEFFVGYPDNAEPPQSDVAAFELLNSVTSSKGIRFRPEAIYNPHNQTHSLMVGVESLAGYRRSISRTHLPGIPPADRIVDWGSLDKWIEQAPANVSSELAAYRELVGDDQDELSPQHLISWGLVGVIKGYPDEAIIAGMRSAVMGEDTELTRVPYGDHYRCAQPNFRFDPDHRDQVDATVQLWGDLLGQYYHSGTHHRLEGDSEFTVARKREE